MRIYELFYAFWGKVGSIHIDGCIAEIIGVARYVVAIPVKASGVAIVVCVIMVIISVAIKSRRVAVIISM